MNKKAVSELIGVVLMITMALVMAGLVYGWLKFYVSKPIPEDLCPDGISLIVSEYQCLAESRINITFQNQGRFDIDQVLIKINNETGKPAIYPLFEMRMQDDGTLAEIPLIYIPFSPNVLSSGDRQTKTFSYEKYSKIVTMEIEPTKGTDKYGRPILCQKAITSLPVQCP